MAIDAGKLLGKLRGEADKRQVNLYIDKTLYKQFQGLCAGVAASKVVEELIREFIQSALQPTQTPAPDLSTVSREFLSILPALDESQVLALLEGAKAMLSESSPALKPKKKHK